jgi:hypothetical protein
MTGRRHPDVPLAPPMNTKRKWIAAFALLMLVLSIAPAAIKERDDQTLQLKNSSLQNILQSIREHRAEQEHQVPARKR